MSKGICIIVVSFLLFLSSCDNSIERFNEARENASKPPEAPTLLTVSPGDNANTLEWSKVAGAEYYIVNWQEGDGADHGEIQVQGESLDHVGIKNQVVYQYTVSVVANNKTSAKSNSLSAMPYAKVLVVSAGFDHTCAIKENHTLWCWGSGFAGRLGVGDEIDRSTPTQESTYASDWEMLDAGNGRVCAINQSGNLYCWGKRLLVNSGYSLNPVLVNDASDWKSVSVGEVICAIKTNNTLFCWGVNTYGQLGVDPTVGFSYATPTQEALKATDWNTVSVGAFHTCALRNDGNTSGKTLWCWGNNDASQIGTTTQNRIQAIPIQVGNDNNWVSVHASGDYTCGLKSDNTIECWGSNGFGSAGKDPEISTVVIPTRISGTDWVDLRSGYSNSCALDSGGYMYCWGDNSKSQLGSGSIRSSHIPLQIGSTGDNDWLMFDVGGQQTCGVRQNQQLYCWGSNSSGQAGNGLFGYKTVPTEIANNEKPWLALSVGDHHTCAIQKNSLAGSTGSLWCWGDNRFGTLGIGNNLDQPIPVPLNQGDSWSQVSAGSDFQCALKQSTPGHKLFCWGDSSDGKLGVGQVVPGTGLKVPVQEATLSSDWVQLDSGGYHTCATRTDGSLSCWGRNNRGQLGDGTVDAKNAPGNSVTAGSDGWVQVVAGMEHTCGFMRSANIPMIYCWGSNYSGELGLDVPQLDNTLPQPVSGSGTGKFWLWVFAGASSTCATEQSGKLWCWGAMANSGFPFEGQNLPTQMSTEGWITISLGYGSYCGIRIDRSLWCWGANNNGQLGNGSRDQVTFDFITEEATKSRDWREVHVGRDHTCALKNDGRIFCWGAGNGSVGDGSAFYADPQLVLFP